MSVTFGWVTPLAQESNLLSLHGEKDAKMPTSRSTVPIFPFEISHCQRQRSHLMENRFANLQGQNNNSIKSLSHPSQTTEVEMKISCLCTSDMFLTQQSASHPHPPSTWAKGTICSQQPEKSFCYFANLRKKRTPSAWLCVKREFDENFHMFVSRCVNFQCCTLSGDVGFRPSV